MTKNIMKIRYDTVNINLKPSMLVAKNKFQWISKSQ